MGRIGKALAKKAEALGMKVVYNDMFETSWIIIWILQLDELLRTSDFISLHVPYDKNKGL